MDFFYPNKINDFWRVMGVIFMNDKNAFWDSGQQRFDIQAIKAFDTRKGDTNLENHTQIYCFFCV